MELGFTTFALKILKMINKLDRDPKVLSEWSEFINSFQTNKFRNIPNNFYVDPAMVSSYDNYSITDSLKDNTKKY